MYNNKYSLIGVTSVFLGQIFVWTPSLNVHTQFVMKTTLSSLYIFNTTKTNTTFDEVRKDLDIFTDRKSSNSSCMIQRDNLR